MIQLWMEANVPGTLWKSESTFRDAFSIILTSFWFSNFLLFLGFFVFRFVVGVSASSSLSVVSMSFLLCIMFPVSLCGSFACFRLDCCWKYFLPDWKGTEFDGRIVPMERFWISCWHSNDPLSLSRSLSLCLWMSVHLCRPLQFHSWPAAFWTLWVKRRLSLNRRNIL